MLNVNSKPSKVLWKVFLNDHFLGLVETPRIDLELAKSKAISMFNLTSEQSNQLKLIELPNPQIIIKSFNFNDEVRYDQ